MKTVVTTRLQVIIFLLSISVFSIGQSNTIHIFNPDPMTFSGTDYSLGDDAKPNSFFSPAYEAKPQSQMPQFLNEQVSLSKLNRLVADLETFDNFQLANWLSGATTDAGIIQRFNIWSLADEVGSDFARNCNCIGKAIISKNQ